MSKGYIVFDETWHRLVRFVDDSPSQEPALWQALDASVTKDKGVTLFKTKSDARRAIRLTRKWKSYAWSANKYTVFEVR